MIFKPAFLDRIFFGLGIARFVAVETEGEIPATGVRCALKTRSRFKLAFTTQQMDRDLREQFRYSAHYSDGVYEYRYLSSSVDHESHLTDKTNSTVQTYRHVILPQQITKYIPKDRLLTETEWRRLGVTQSEGWVHYAYHKPEPHILLFRREVGRA
jgi:cyclin-dependent kinase regulatory subunit CKS1